MMMSLKKEMVALAQQQNNYVYIVRCRDQTLYTGWTNQLEKRIEAITLVKVLNIQRQEDQSNLFILKLLNIKARL